MYIFFFTYQINAEKMELGFPKCPLTVSYIGDYGEDIKKTNESEKKSPFNMTASYSNEIYKPEHTASTPSVTQVIYLFIFFIQFLIFFFFIKTFSDYEAMVLQQFRQAGKPKQENRDSNNIDPEERVA